MSIFTWKFCIKYLGGYQTYCVFCTLWPCFFLVFAITSAYFNSTKVKFTGKLLRFNWRIHHIIFIICPIRSQIKFSFADKIKDTNLILIDCASSYFRNLFIGKEFWILTFNKAIFKILIIWIQIILSLKISKVRNIFLLRLLNNFILIVLKLMLFLSWLQNYLRLTI